ncbi:MAG: hypothetical protein AABX16_04750, partial [Nanoarchaeota archaeon]
MKPFELKNDVLTIYRDITELDIFVKDFLEILKKHSDYLVVSGFVSIATGRTRGTEDVDVLFPLLSKEKNTLLIKELQKNNFWCFQGDTADEIYPYIKNLESIRCAKKDQIYPNIELIPITHHRKAKYFEFTHPQKIIIKNKNLFEFKIPPLEFEILYKEIILAGEKDMQDAQHLRTIFASILSEKKFKEYRPIIE